MKHILLLVPLFIVAVIFFMLYQRGMQIKAEEKKHIQQEAQTTLQKKNLQLCLAKEDASITQSMQNDCAEGTQPKNCTVPRRDMKEIMQRVNENKEICRLKFSN